MRWMPQTPKDPPYWAWRESIQVNLLERDKDGQAHASMVLGSLYRAYQWLPAVLDETHDNPRWCHAKES